MSEKKCDLKMIGGKNSTLFTVKVSPAASRDSLDGFYDGMMKVKLSAAPEKGKANQALIKFLSKKLDFKKKSIKIIAGKQSKIKQIEIENTDPSSLRRRLNG